MVIKEIPTYGTMLDQYGSYEPGYMIDYITNPERRIIPNWLKNQNLNPNYKRPDDLTLLFDDIYVLGDEDKAGQFGNPRQTSNHKYYYYDYTPDSILVIPNFITSIKKNSNICYRINSIQLYNRK